MRTVSQRWQIGGGAVAGVGTSKEAVSYPATEGVLTETTTPEEALTQGTTHAEEVTSEAVLVVEGTVVDLVKTPQDEAATLVAAVVEVMETEAATQTEEEKEEVREVARATEDLTTAAVLQEGAVGVPHQEVPAHSQHNVQLQLSPDRLVL